MYSMMSKLYDGRGSASARTCTAVSRPQRQLDRPGLRSLSRFPAQQRPTVSSNSLRLVHRGEEFGADWNLARRESPQLGVGESEAVEEDVNEGLLDGSRRSGSGSSAKHTGAGRQDAPLLSETLCMFEEVPRAGVGLFQLGLHLVTAHMHRVEM